MTPLYVDLIVVAVIVLSALFAFARGFLREVLSIGAWIVAGLAAWFGWPLLEPIVRQYVDHELISIAVSAAAIFVVVLIVVTVISHVFTTRVRESSLGALDRSLGLLFGLVRGALIVCVALMIMDQFYDKTQRPEWITQAKSYRLVDAGAEILYGIIPPAILKQGESTADAVKSGAEQAADITQAIQVITGASQQGAADPAAGDADSGYGEADRNAMDRAMQQSSQ